MKKIYISIFLLFFVTCSSDFKKNEKISREDVLKTFNDFFASVDNDYTKMKDFVTEDFIIYEVGRKWNTDEFVEFVKTNFDSDEDITVDQSFDLIISCIDQVYNEEESWNASDCTKKEMTEFLEQLSSKQFKEVEKFFDTMPKLSHTIKVTNPKTKVKNEVLLEGLSSFFE